MPSRNTTQSGRLQSTPHSPLIRLLPSIVFILSSSVGISFTLVVNNQPSLVRLDSVQPSNTSSSEGSAAHHSPENGLLIAVLVLVCLIIVGMLVWLLTRWRSRRSRSTSRWRSNFSTSPEQASEIGQVATSEVQTEPPVSVLSPIRSTEESAQPSIHLLPPPLSLPAEDPISPVDVPAGREDDMLTESTSQPTNVLINKITRPAAQSMKLKKKPAPLVLSSVKALPPAPADGEVDQPGSSNTLAYFSKLKERRESSTGHQEVSSSSKQTLVHPDKDSSIMLAFAAHSRLFQPGSSSSPPVTPSVAQHVRHRTISTSGLERGKGEQWAAKRRALSTLQVRTPSLARPRAEVDSGPIRYHSNFRLPISATPPDLPTTPEVEIPRHRREEVSMGSLETVRPAPQASVPTSPTIASHSRLQVPGGPSPALYTLLTAGRNSFGVEEQKRSENEPSSAPMIQISDHFLAEQLQYGLSSTFSDDESRTPSSEEGASRSSNAGTNRDRHGNSSTGNSRNVSRKQSRASRLAESKPQTSSSLSLRSSMQRAQQWLQSEPSSSNYKII